MKIELVTIGNEVLNGYTLNTNAQFIAQNLFQEGYKLLRETNVSDEPDELYQALDESLTRSNFVITTGGLGPTLDDISEEIAEKLVKAKPSLIVNKLGSAPGLIFQKDGHSLIMLPGVPNEMRPMLFDSVIPLIKKLFPLKKRPFRRVLCFTRLPEIKVDPLLREFKERYPSLEFGIYPSLGLLQVHLYAIAEEEKIAQELIKPAYEMLKTQFADHFFESSSGTIEGALHRLFIQKGWTLGIAESCTGGSIASRLTQLSGASQYFVGSIVSYSNESKIASLGVSKASIEQYGAVSQEVVQEMVLGASKVFNSDFNIAVTGVAGPSGGTDEKPVGTVWLAIYRKGKEPITWSIKARGHRGMVISWSVNEILGKLYHYAKNEI